MRIALPLVATAVLALTVAGCSKPMNWNGPGWYLQMPHVGIPGADYYGGPMSYDECEAARKKETVADKMLCSMILKQPE